MNNLSRLYESKNHELLETISVLNFSLGFDKSIASFKGSDLFSFLKQIDTFDFKCHDDLEYMIDMLCDAFNHISCFLSSQIRRTHEVMPLSRAKELDRKSIEWITRQNGITIKQKLAQGKVLGVKRYNFIDNPENRVLKIVLMRLIEVYDFRKFDERLHTKMIHFVRDNLSEVNHKTQIVPNNILLYHKHYAKFYKAYQWLNHLESIMSDFRSFEKSVLNTREHLKKIIVLSLLHKYTKARILPSTLRINQKEYRVNFEDRWLLDVEIDEYLNHENDLKKFKDECQKSIMASSKLKRITLPPKTINSDNSKIFMDIFRLYPQCYIDSKQMTMPLLLRQGIDNQEIDNKTINANHTKIINMDKPFYTLPQSLLSKENKVFNIFLCDIKNFVGKSNELYYILPDYINVFDFNDKHRSIKTYFNQAFFINKSILAAAKMLFNNELKKDDTLLYFQKNNLNEIFVTPILVQYKDALKNSKSKGLYLEKHPSKKYKSNPQNRDKIAQKLLEKCLQNGAKALIKNDVKLYLDGKVINMPNIQEEKVDNDINRVKSLYEKSRSLFKTSIQIIQDNPEENLKLFKELMEQKEVGFKLWGERLPKLDMDIDDGIKNKKFNLINENSELDFENEIHIEERFIIPANVETISTPLFLENEEIDYFMLLETDVTQSEEPITCELTLKYSYDSENIYTLIFTPLDGKMSPMQAKWCKGKIKQKRKNMFDVYPPYPPIKSIDELRRYPKINSSKTINLFDWVERSIQRIQGEQEYMKKANVYHIKFGESYCFAKDDSGNEIFCHKDRWINPEEWDNLSEGDPIFLIKYKTPKGYRGEFISSSKEKTFLSHIEKTSLKIKNILFNTRFPMISIFNGHSLTDADFPNLFRNTITKFLDFMKNFEGIDKKLDSEFLFFCSIMHDCSPIEKYFNLKDIKDSKLLAYSIGNANVEWQKKILRSVLEDEDRFTKQTSVLAISLWRSESLVFDDMICCKVKKLIENSINWISDKIPNRLFYQSKSSDTLLLQPSLVNILEVLLSLLRLRQKGIDILNPSDKTTQQLIEKLLELNKLIIQKRALLKSYLKLELKKTKEYEEMPDLIYALISFIKGESINSIKIIGVNEYETNDKA